MCVPTCASQTLFKTQLPFKATLSISKKPNLIKYVGLVIVRCVGAGIVKRKLSNVSLEQTAGSGNGG